MRFGTSASRVSGFPRIGDQPYFLSLAPYGFLWFQLREVVTPVTARTGPAGTEPLRT